MSDVLTGRSRRDGERTDGERKEDGEKETKTGYERGGRGVQDREGSINLL